MTVTPNTMEAEEDHKPRYNVFSKMEQIVRDMQHNETGVPVRMQKIFLTTIPCAFTGYDLIEWLIDRLNMEDTQEALHLATLLCHYGYFFPVTDSKNLTVKDDSTLYRFQSPYFWPSQNWEPDNVDYAIYLAKRSLRNKQKHALEEYEQAAFTKLQKMLCDKWDFIYMQAEEQVSFKMIELTMPNAVFNTSYAGHTPARRIHKTHKAHLDQDIVITQDSTGHFQKPLTSGQPMTLNRPSRSCTRSRKSRTSSVKAYSSSPCVFARDSDSGFESNDHSDGSISPNTSGDNDDILRGFTKPPLPPQRMSSWQSRNSSKKRPINSPGKSRQNAVKRIHIEPSFHSSMTSLSSTSSFASSISTSSEASVESTTSSKSSSSTTSTSSRSSSFHKLRRAFSPRILARLASQARSDSDTSNSEPSSPDNSDHSDSEVRNLELPNVKRIVYNNWTASDESGPESVMDFCRALRNSKGSSNLHKSINRKSLRLAKERKKADKVVLDSQEKAFWRVHRPPPGHIKCLEEGVRRNYQPSQMAKRKKKNVEGYQKEIAFLQKFVDHPRMKSSKAAESLIQHYETFQEQDPFLCPPQPSNPWVSDDTSHWSYNSPLSAVLTERRVKRWGFSMQEVLNDPAGLQEFEAFLQKEFSSENLHFWLHCQQLKGLPLSQVPDKVNQIFQEFLAPGAPSEINIDSKTMEHTLKQMKEPSRFTFDKAEEHIYLLMKKDSYNRFVRSDVYKNLLANAVQPSSKKKFFNFTVGGKKKSPVPSPKSKRRGSESQEIMYNENKISQAMSQHSFSTGNLRDLVDPKSNRSSPFGSSGDVKTNDKPGSGVSAHTLNARLENLQRSENSSPCNLDVPKMGYVSPSNSQDGPTVSLNIAVPNAKHNVVAPWEDEEEPKHNVVAPWEDQ